MTAPIVAAGPIPMTIAADLGALAMVLAETSPLPEDSATLAEHLYQHWYLNVRAPAQRRGPPLPAEVDLPAALDAAHSGSTRYEPDWIAERVSSTGRVDASRGRYRRILRAGQYVDLDRPGGRPEPGDRLAVADSFATVDGGFWVTRTWSFMEAGSLPMSRVYLNVRLSGAATAVALLTARLHEAGFPYALKVCLQLSGVQRADSLVVYVPRERFKSIRPDLEAVAVLLDEAGDLESAVPRLTARLRDGLAVADGDGSGASYGQQRCALLADALFGGQGYVDAEVQQRWVTERCVAALEGAGLDPARPYLSAEATRDYAALA